LVKPADLVAALSRLAPTEARSLVERAFANAASHTAVDAIPEDLLRVVAANGAAPLAYMAARILATRTGSSSDWLLVSMKAHCCSRHDMVWNAALRARQAAIDSGDPVAERMVDDWLSAVGPDQPAGDWLRCSVCNRQTSPLIATGSTEAATVCHACAIRIARLVLYGPADVRSGIWQVADNVALPDSPVPLMGRDVAAEWFVEQGQLHDGLAIAAQAILLDDAMLSSRALRLMLGPKLARAGAWPKLLEALRGALL
jgi:hypothetical protein